MNAADAADRHGEQRGQSDQDERAHDGVRHPAARLPDGLRQLGEEREVQRAEAFLDHVEEDERERQQRQQDGGGAEDFDQPRDELPPAPAHAVFILQINSRENALMKTVMIKSSSPISMSACTYSSSAASVNSLAMTAAIVYCGLYSEAEMIGLLPMTMVTAMVSPSARPKPSMTAPRMPLLP